MPDKSQPDMATTSIHADKAHKQTNSLAPPIHQTTTFTAETEAQFNEMATQPQHPRFYTRYGNPNHAQVQEIIARLEKTDAALVTASGMGALVAVLMTFLESDAHVVAQKVHYGGTIGFLEKVLSKFGVSATFVDQADVAGFEAAIQSNTKMMIVETPTNPLMLITDLKAIGELARKHNILTIADNTFATPVNQRPIELGIDLVYHSATKYLGGHHDVIAGAIAGPADLIEEIWRTSIALGATLNAFDSWLMLRGLRTLPLRVRQHNENALAVAKALQKHPKISAVYYPGLEDHPQYELAKSQMDGFTGMLSFEIDGDYQMAQSFLSNLKLVERAASLGGIHTLIVHPAAMLAAVLTEEQFIERGVLPSLVRLSVGLEGAEDIIHDISQALDQLV